MNLTPEQINTAIAESLGGWRRVWNREKTKALLVSPKNKYDFCDQDLSGLEVAGTANGEVIPNYHGDLNACRDAEELLDEKQKREFSNHIWDLMLKTTKRNPWWLGPYKFELIHASAPQRCEALLRTIGKWPTA